VLDTWFCCFHDSCVKIVCQEMKRKMLMIKVDIFLIVTLTKLRTFICVFPAPCAVLATYASSDDLVSGHLVLGRDCSLCCVTMYSGFLLCTCLSRDEVSMFFSHVMKYLCFCSMRHI